jgi:gamma-glutamyl-gamma-aminobutyrate hydrolase PuuD
MDQQPLQVQDIECHLCSHIVPLIEQRRPRSARRPPASRPSIGVFASSGILREGGWPVYGADQPTLDAVYAAGGYPVGLSTFPITPGLDAFEVLTDADAFRAVFDVIWPVVRDLDGLVFSGGGDLDARLFYRQAPHPQAQPPDLWRDVWEWFAALLAWVTYKPTLGICRGMQLLNVVRGGGLFQDQQELRSRWTRDMPPLLEHRRGRPHVQNWITHPLIIKPETWLAQAVQGRGTQQPPRHCLDAVLSQHHQSIGFVRPHSQEVVGHLAPDLEVVAFSPDRVIEAIADRDPRRVYVGVQFHPEYVRFFTWALGIFTHLVDASMLYAPLSRPYLESCRESIQTWLWLSARAPRITSGSTPLALTNEHLYEQRRADEGSHHGVPITEHA